MITLGMLLGKIITSNPPVMVMITEKDGKGKLMEIESIKLGKVGNDPVIVLTI